MVILDTYLSSVIFQVVSYSKPKSSCTETLQSRPIGTSSESGNLMTCNKNATFSKSNIWIDLVSGVVRALPSLQVPCSAYTKLRKKIGKLEVK